jgi:mRNA-degrading endonuclease toxin of MazEF toxin-antitoxin module
VIIVVNVPFSNHSGYKARPALVVSPESFHGRLPDLIICPISSQNRYYRKPGRGDVPLRQWKTTGLRHPSTVRVSKILSLDKQIIKSVLGKIADSDLAATEVALNEARGLKA